MKLSIYGAVAAQTVSPHTRVHKGKGKGPSRLRCFECRVPRVDTSIRDAEHDEGESLNTGLGNLGDFDLG